MRCVAPSSRASASGKHSTELIGKPHGVGVRVGPPDVCSAERVPGALRRAREALDRHRSDRLRQHQAPALFRRCVSRARRSERVVHRVDVRSRVELQEVEATAAAAAAVQEHALPVLAHAGQMRVTGDHDVRSLLSRDV